MTIEFIVEHIIISKGQKPYIIVRQLMPKQNFSVSDNSVLNGIPIEPSIISPRACSENGEPRFDFYIFTPIHSKDISNFEINKQVLLETSN